MRFLKRIFSLIILVCIFWGFTIQAKAQVRAQAVLSSDVVSIGQPFYLVYQVVYENGEADIEVPSPIPNFKIIDKESQIGQSYSNVNGVTSQTQTKTILVKLIATKSGHFSLPPARISNQGKYYTTNKNSITVINQAYAPSASAPQTSTGNAMGGFSAMPENQEPQVGKDIYVKAYTNKRQVYVGEPLNVTYKLVTRMGMEAQLQEMPQLNGFWLQDFKIPQPVQPQTEVIDGQKFSTFLLKKSIAFPVKAGTLILDPAKIACTVRDSWGMPDEEILLASDPIDIEVKPLPNVGSYQGFTGAVGKYSVNAFWDKNQITTDDEAILIVKVSGTGNINLIGKPQLTLPEGMSVVSVSSKPNVASIVPDVQGDMTFTYHISVGKTGTFKFEPFKFSYFDPQTGTYAAANPNEVTLTVNQGKGIQAIFTGNINDINPINKNAQFTLGNKPWVLSTGFWAACAFPFMALIGLLAWRKRDTKIPNVLSKQQKAEAEARKRLKKAELLLNSDESTAFYEEMSKAIWLYISDKLSIPLSELNRNTVVDKLQDNQVPPDAIQQTIHLFDEVQLALYSPSGGVQARKDTLNQGVNLIVLLSKFMGKK